MNTFSASLLARAFSWAILYSLWQGLLIYAATFVLLKALPSISARIKYYLSLSAFAAISIWFADTFISQYERLRGTLVFITTPGIDHLHATTYTVKAITGDGAPQDILHSYLPQLEHYSPFIMFLYSAGLIFMLFRFVVGYLQANALKTQGIVQPEPHLNEMLLKWKKQLEITRPVRLLLSARVDVPMMVGVLKPVVLLPIATVNHLSTGQVEAILMHELAHIRRNDYLLNLLQTIGEAILFFNPFVWLISATIRRERELCCDDLVVESAASPLSYAQALAILEDRRINDHALALAATGNKNQLFHRIKRIMEMKKKNHSYGQFAIIVIAIVAVVLIAIMCTYTPSMAQKVKAGGGDDTVKKAEYKYRAVTIDSNGKKTVVEKHSSSMGGDNDKDDEEKENDNEVSVSMHDDTDGKGAHSSAYSYSYSYSDDGGDDIKDIIKDVTIITKDAIDAVSKINMDEVNKQVEKARAEVNSVDWGEIEREINKSMAEVDRELSDPKLQKKIKEGIEKGMEQGRQELEEAKKQMEQAKIQMEDAKKQIREQRQMAEARPSAPKDGGVSSANFDEMLKKMEKDGLIDRSKSYKIKKEDGELYINGELQPESVYKKYHKYLQYKSATIKGKKGAMSISLND